MFAARAGGYAFIVDMIYVSRPIVVPNAARLAYRDGNPGRYLTAELSTFPFSSVARSIKISAGVSTGAAGVRV